jgi:hypothetical protein
MSPMSRTGQELLALDHDPKIAFTSARADFVRLGVELAVSSSVFKAYQTRSLHMF